MGRAGRPTVEITLTEHWLRELMAKLKYVWPVLLAAGWRMPRSAGADSRMHRRRAHGGAERT